MFVETDVFDGQGVRSSPDSLTASRGLISCLLRAPPRSSSEPEPRGQCEAFGKPRARVPGAECFRVPPTLVSQAGESSVGKLAGHKQIGLAAAPAAATPLVPTRVSFEEARY